MNSAGSQHKIVFSGPVGAGKTTAIAAISEKPPVSTEQRATDETRHMKETTTVAMDYGSIRLPDNTLISLYGTPGQKRFDFMWNILSRGAIGLVLVIDHQASDPLADLATYIQAFAETFHPHNTVIGVNKFSHDDGPSWQDYHQTLGVIGCPSPLLEIDARDRSDVAMLIQALLFSIEPGLQSF